MATPDTRARVLDAAFARVAEVGLSRLALEDVASGAGVSRQTVYRHFGSREGLVEALVLREERWFFDRVVAAAEGAATPEDAIAASVTEALQAAVEHPLLRTLLRTEPGEILPLVVLGEGPVISAARPVVMRILAEQLDLVAEDAQLMADVCSRLMVSFVLDPGPDRPADVGRRIARMIVRGLLRGEGADA